jgi:hypothetical protein
VKLGVIQLPDSIGVIKERRCKKLKRFATLVGWRKALAKISPQHAHDPLPATPPLIRVMRWHCHP